MPTIRFANGSALLVKAGAPARPPFRPGATLCIAAAYSNPQNWRSRRRLFEDFRAYITRLPNVRLFVGELAYGRDPFQVTSRRNPDDLQLRADQPLWHKENILNLVIAKRFPKQWLYGAYVDGDFHFSRNDVAAKAIRQLQTHDWVQFFSSYSNLSIDHRIVSSMPSFAWCRHAGRKCTGDNKYGDLCVGACGGAWAFRRDAYEAAGGLLDFCITGSADWHMAFGLYGHADPHPELRQCFPEYVSAIRSWQVKARESVHRPLGFIESHAWHYWHGPIANRGYGTRWRILRDGHYDPAHDLYRNGDGVLQLIASKRRMGEAILQYFRSRNEDAAA
jgi:hypothetical protein